MRNVQIWPHLNFSMTLYIRQLLLFVASANRLFLLWLFGVVPRIDVIYHRFVLTPADIFSGSLISKTSYPFLRILCLPFGIFTRHFCRTHLSWPQLLEVCEVFTKSHHHFNAHGESNGDHPPDIHLTEQNLWGRISICCARSRSIGCALQGTAQDLLQSNVSPVLSVWCFVFP